MQRILKFRVWDKILKCFLFDHRNTGLFFSRHQDITLGDLAVSYFITNSDSVVQQFIGLKDKDGKEIYEGDILEQDVFQTCTTLTESVIFEDGAFRISPNYPNTYYRSNLNLDAVLIRAYNYKIIGNIFENPDLIEKL